MSELNDTKQKAFDKEFIQTIEQPKIPTKPSELVAEVLDVDLAQQRVDGPSPIYPFMHGLLCGLKLSGL